MAAKKLPDGYIDIPTAARMLHIAPQTMYQWVLFKGRVPYKSRISGTRTYYMLKLSDVKKLLEEVEPTRLRKAKLYEIIIITCGKLEVLFKTDNLHELSNKYTHLMEHGHKLVRLRVDGRVLTIHESDKVGYTYHPRMKKGAVV